MSSTLFANGRFYTMDSNRPVVEAVYVRDGRIRSLGTLPKVQGQMSGPYRVEDLGMHPVVPAFTDAHIHLGDYALRTRQVDLSDATTLEHALDLVRDHLEDDPGTGWIRGGGWDKNNWLGGDWPAARDLDRFCPHRPVALLSKDCEALWVNSRALEMAGIAHLRPKHPSGRILLGEDPPSGVLLGESMALIENIMPPISLEEQAEAVLESQKELHAFGITGVHVPEGPDVFLCLQSLLGRDQLSLRSYLMIPGDLLDHALALGISTGFGHSMLRVGPVKMHADGTLGQQTAHLLEPYESYPFDYVGDGTGEGELENLVKRCTQGGLASAIHAIGDAANRRALEALENCLSVPYKSRVEHAQLVTPEDALRFGQLKLTASMQPSHIFSDWQLVVEHWGERSRYAFPFKSLLSAGANLAFGSDAPAESIDPIRGIYAAVHHNASISPPDNPWPPEQALPVEEAVRAYTLGPALSEHAPLERGILREGSWADMAVLTHDIIGQPELLNYAQVAATFLGGEMVYEED